MELSDEVVGLEPRSPARRDPPVARQRPYLDRGTKVVAFHLRARRGLAYGRAERSTSGGFTRCSLLPEIRKRLARVLGSRAGAAAGVALTPSGRGRPVGLHEAFSQGAAVSADFSGTSTSTRRVNLRVSPGRSAPTPTTRLVSICPGPSWTSMRTVYSQGASVPGCRIVPSTLSGHTVDWAGLARVTASTCRCR